MIQDLGDKKLDNAYQNQTPEPGDQFFRFDRDKILVKTLPGGRLCYPPQENWAARRDSICFPSATTGTFWNFRQGGQGT